MTLAYPTTLARRKSTSYLQRLDWVLIGGALALSIIGALLVYSATRSKQGDAGLDPQSYLKKHILNLVVGLVLGIVISRLDYRLLRAYTPILYGVILGTSLKHMSGASPDSRHHPGVLDGAIRE